MLLPILIVQKFGTETREIKLKRPLHNTKARRNGAK